jgi:hypothetical protein
MNLVVSRQLVTSLQGLVTHANEADCLRLAAQAQLEHARLLFTAVSGHSSWEYDHSLS